MVLKQDINNILKPKSKDNIIKDLRILSQKEKDKKLINASANGQLEIVKWLIEADADINAKDKDKNTPVLLAYIYGQVKVVDFLIRMGANINVKNIHKYTIKKYNN